ncbi:MAG: hypothetical protein NT069_11320 [Planctomycetota bacterium]|nr:hypothetical protein [Planctomycetota bacterium]
MSRMQVPTTFDADVLRQAIHDALDDTLAEFDDVRPAMAFLWELTARLCDFRATAALNRRLSHESLSPVGYHYRPVERGVVEVTAVADKNGQLEGHPGASLRFNEAEAYRAIQTLLANFPRIRAKLAAPKN